MFEYCQLPGRAMLRINGDDAYDFLQGIVTADMRELEGKPVIFSAMLSPQGKFLYDFFIIRHGEGVLIDMEEDALEPLQKKFKLYKLRSHIEMVDVSDQWETYAVWGKSMTQAHILPGCISALDSRLHAMGRRVYCPVKQLFKPGPEGQEASFDDYDRHRLELGVPDGSRDASDRNFLLELGYDQLGAVSFTKGCYIGQEVTARMQHRLVLRKCLFQIRTESGELPPVGVAITAGDAEIGDMRSSSGPFGLAQLRIAEWKAAVATGTPIMAGPLTLTATPPAYMQEKIDSLPADSGTEPL